MGRIWTFCQNCSKLADVCLDSTKLGQTPAKFDGRTWPHFGQIRPGAGRIRPESATAGRIEQRPPTWVKLWPALARIPASGAIVRQVLDNRSAAFRQPQMSPGAPGVTDFSGHAASNFSATLGDGRFRYRWNACKTTVLGIHLFSGVANWWLSSGYTPPRPQGGRSAAVPLPCMRPRPLGKYTQANYNMQTAAADFVELTLYWTATQSQRARGLLIFGVPLKKEPGQ